MSFSDDSGNIIRFSADQCAALEASRTICHNDLEPRNILVREAKPNGDTKVHDFMYEVIAIVDWEMAGVYPFIYEYGLKDNELGSSNLMYSWYAMFKSYTLPLVLAHSAQEPNQADQVFIRVYTGTTRRAEPRM